MTDRPLIFSAPMVRAILDGRKTQTRRVLKPQESALLPPGGMRLQIGEHGWEWCRLDGPDKAFYEICSVKWKPGDRAWVRETWKPGAWRDDGRVAIDYRASPEMTRTPWVSLPDRLDWDDVWLAWTDEARRAGFVPDNYGFLHWEPGQSPLRWRSPIHMPRWASRITLTITDVRVQRVQDITEADAEAEGVEPILVPPDGGGAPHIEGFRDTWTAIHGPGSWDANPWVAALTFTVEKESR